MVLKQIRMNFGPVGLGGPSSVSPDEEEDFSTTLSATRMTPGGLDRMPVLRKRSLAVTVFHVLVFRTLGRSDATELCFLQDEESSRISSRPILSLLPVL